MTIPQAPKGYRLPVSFRVWPDGDVMAVFPTIPADIEGQYCQSYMHIGQHGASVTRHTDTRPATPDEYAPLLSELYAIGYDHLWPIKRVTRQMDEQRRKVARELGLSD